MSDGKEPKYWISILDESQVYRVENGWSTHLTIRSSLDIYYQTLDIWRSDSTDYIWSIRDKCWYGGPLYNKSQEGICYRGTAVGMTHYIRMNHDYIQLPDSDKRILFDTWLFGFCQYDTSLSDQPKDCDAKMITCPDCDQRLLLHTGSTWITFCIVESIGKPKFKVLPDWPYGKANAIHVKAK